MFQPKVKIIKDSVNAATGSRITTFVLTYHRFIHSEFMTYRMFSRNASSSRAIPVEKMIQKVIDQQVEPLYWGKNQPGMQASQELSSEEIEQARLQWNAAKATVISYARQMIEKGVHKQIVNRILEPFSTITVICTSTDYQNFFNQRCHPDAQPEIQALAYLMKAEYDKSKPDILYPGEWHLPFYDLENDKGIFGDDILKVCVGRCARVSYLNHDGKRNLSKDIELHDKLLVANPKHLSPFEHVAIAQTGNNANFLDFKSYRYILENSGL
ncbi:hypothetical protein NIES2100_05370 [Calothrix sp. NIES-2100]|uniref:FAD-dependent thymidylate synthase n=1 Tax=Calothrix sp. NIES-2100 TaxID=1954172 RepID=UPI000B6208D8|nr:hypothetical protein NIES2100_05370 [Calothrix sp. NIES-2100]